MDLMHASNGFIFIAVFTGLMGFFGAIVTGLAISDEKDYAGFFVFVEIILILVFLTSGFLGFATK